VVNAANYKTSNSQKIAISKDKFSMRKSLGKPMRRAQHGHTGHQLEAAVDTSLLRPALLAPLLLLALLPRHALAAPPAKDFEQRCEREMLPSFQVSAHRPGFVVHNTVSSSALNNRGAYNYAGQVMLGMTASSTRAEIDIDGPSLSDPASGRECIAPIISVQLSYQPLNVYVAREFHPASCPYRVVYAHEMQHVKIYMDNLPRLEQLVRGELVKRYAGRPLYAPRGQGLTVLQEQIDTWLRPLIKDELAKVEAQQVALDGGDETERLSHSCQGEVASLMGSTF
jgi:hypothetical protein